MRSESFFAAVVSKSVARREVMEACSWARDAARDSRAGETSLLEAVKRLVLEDIERQD